MALTWTGRANDLDGGLGSRVCWSPDLSLFVAVGTAGSDVIVTSTDGLTWAGTGVALDGPITDVCWSPTLGLFAAVGNDAPFPTAAIYTSPDGQMWTAATTPLDGQQLGQSICWADGLGLFVAGFSTFLGTEVIATSPDGVTWTPVSSPFDGNVVYGIAWSEPLGLLVATGTGPLEIVATSPDGSVWTPVASPLDGSAGSFAAWLPTLAIFAVGAAPGAAALITSPDGSAWTSIATDFDTGGCFGAADIGTGAILVGADAGGTVTILESTDGAVWTADPTSPFTGGSGNGAAYSPELFLAITVGTDLSASVTIASAPTAAPPTPTVRFSRGFPWRFIVTDLDTVVTTSLERLAANRTVTFGLNRPATTSGRVPSDDPRVNITDVESGLDAPHLSFADRLMYGFRREQRNPDRWVIRFAGIVEQIEDTANADQPYSTYTAWDPWQYLFHLPVAINSEGDLIGPAGYEFTGVPGSLIAATLLADVIASFGPTRIDAGVTYQGTAEWAGTIEATANVTIKFQQGTMLGDAWRQLVAQGGMDIVLTPIWDPVNRPGYCCDLSIYAEAGTTRDAAVFSWDVGRAVVGISSLLDGDQMANNVKFYTGKGGPAVTLQTDASSEARYGPYWAMQFWPARSGAANVVSTEALAAYQLNLRRQGRRSVAISPNPLLSPKPFIDYTLGDKVPVYATRRLRQQIPWSNEATVYQRIYGIPITLGDDGVERVERLIASPDGF